MKKVLFGVTVLGLLGLVGTGIGSTVHEAIEAKADSGDESRTVYFDYSGMSDTWKNATKIYARYWTGSSQYAECVATGVNYVVSFTFTPNQVNNNGFEFRTNATGAEDENSTEWVSLAGLGNKNIVYGHNSVGRATYEFKQLDADAARVDTPFVVYEDVLSPSYVTERFWASTVDVSSYWKTAPVARVGVNGKANYYRMASYVNSGTTYYYVDVPVTWTYIDFIRPMESGLRAWWNTTQVQEHGISYIKDNGAGGNYTDRGNMPNATAESVGKALEGYLTCSSSARNGYGSANLLKTNFVDSLAGGQDLSLVNITDYNDHDTVEEYGIGDAKGKSVSVQDKWDAMYASYTAANSGAFNVTASIGSDHSSIWLVGALATATLLGAGLFLLARKRRAE